MQQMISLSKLQTHDLSHKNYMFLPLDQILVPVLLNIITYI